MPHDNKLVKNKTHHFMRSLLPSLYKEIATTKNHLDHLKHRLEKKSGSDSIKLTDCLTEVSARLSMTLSLLGSLTKGFRDDPLWRMGGPLVITILGVMVGVIAPQLNNIYRLHMDHGALILTVYAVGVVAIVGGIFFTWAIYL